MDRTNPPGVIVVPSDFNPNPIVLDESEESMVRNLLAQGQFVNVYHNNSKYWINVNQTLITRNELNEVLSKLAVAV